jgi:hypothetical protein
LPAGLAGEAVCTDNGAPEPVVIVLRCSFVVSAPSSFLLLLLLLLPLLLLVLLMLLVLLSPTDVGGSWLDCAQQADAA